MYFPPWDPVRMDIVVSAWCPRKCFHPVFNIQRSKHLYAPGVLLWVSRASGLGMNEVRFLGENKSYHRGLYFSFVQMLFHFTSALEQSNTLPLLPPQIPFRSISVKTLKANTHAQKTLKANTHAHTRSESRTYDHTQPHTYNHIQAHITTCTHTSTHNHMHTQPHSHMITHNHT